MTDERKKRIAMSSIKRSIGEQNPVTSIPKINNQSSLNTTNYRIGNVDLRAIKPSVSAKFSTVTSLRDRIEQEDGVAFEDRCEAELASHGWRTERTPVTGDFGADILAYRGVHSVAIQCKRYASPVGNGAVQEAFSARSHYQTRSAAVIAINGFTKAAQISAERLSVALLDFNDLPILEQRL
jgi:HJR/Mrr/RecB family endonuclease